VVTIYDWINGQTNIPMGQPKNIMPSLTLSGGEDIKIHY